MLLVLFDALSLEAFCFLYLFSEVLLLFLMRALAPKEEGKLIRNVVVLDIVGLISILRMALQ